MIVNQTSITAAIPIFGSATIFSFLAVYMCGRAQPEVVIANNGITTIYIPLIEMCFFAAARYYDSLTQRKKSYSRCSALFSSIRLQQLVSGYLNLYKQKKVVRNQILAS